LEIPLSHPARTLLGDAGSFALGENWNAEPDGRAWSRPEGSSLTLSLAQPVPPERSAFARLRLLVRSGKPIRAVGLLVGVNGVTVEDAILFGGGEQDITVALPRATHGGYAIKLRAFDPGAPARGERIVPGRRAMVAGNADAALPAVSLLGLTVEQRADGRRYKAALIAAGHAAANALFPVEARENSWWNAGDLAFALERAIAARTPFSVVRLGDGEGRLLGYPWLLSEAEMVNETIGYMFGREAVASLSRTLGAKGLSHAVITLQRLVVQAVSNADCVGLPAPLHFNRYAEMPEGHERDKRRNGLVGMAGALLGAAKYISHLPDDRLFDTYIFSGVHHKKLFEQFLNDLEFVGVVSHTDFTSRIVEHFRIRAALHIRIPGHQSFMPSAELHFPNSYEAVIERLLVPFPGAVFLVAAGYLGKAYCDVIKQRGGIAIDIGAVFDAWFGVGRVEANSVSRLS
jgi:hypothetical protein